MEFEEALRSLQSPARSRAREKRSTTTSSLVLEIVLIVIVLVTVLAHLWLWTLSTPLEDPRISALADRVNYNTWLLMRSGIGYYQAYDISSVEFFGSHAVGIPDETARPPLLFILWSLLPTVSAIKILYVAFAAIGISGAYVFCREIANGRIVGTLAGVLCSVSMLFFFEHECWFYTEHWVSAVLTVGFAFYIRKNMKAAVATFLVALAMKEMIFLLILAGTVTHLLFKRDDPEGTAWWLVGSFAGFGFIDLQACLVQTNFLSAMRLTHGGQLRVLHGFYPESLGLIFSWPMFPSHPFQLIVAALALLLFEYQEAFFLGGLLTGPLLLVLTDPPAMVSSTGGKWALLTVLLEYLLSPLGVALMVRAIGLAALRGIRRMTQSRLVQLRMFTNHSGTDVTKLR